MSERHEGVRDHSLAQFRRADRRSLPVQSARGQNFIVHWADFGEAGASFRCSSGQETLLLFPDVAGRAACRGVEVAVPPRSVCILPAGAVEVSLDEPGLVVALSSDADPHRMATAINAADYAFPNPHVAPIGDPFRRVGPAGVRVIEVDRIEPAAGRPRLKMIQSATMSINWVEYEGQRDRTKLSPHSHDDFEQGSLAIHGSYVNHLRFPWGPDANAWREDLHVAAPEASLTVIPPGLIHTTEGIGPGRHLLIDIFAPARADFIEKGWIANAGDYARPV